VANSARRRDGFGEPAHIGSQSLIVNAPASGRRPSCGARQDRRFVYPIVYPRRLFPGHTAAGNLQEVIAAQRQVLPIVDPLSAKPPKADIDERG